jgi:hypothetical protein
MRHDDKQEAARRPPEVGEHIQIPKPALRGKDEMDEAQASSQIKIVSLGCGFKVR